MKFRDLRVLSGETIFSFEHRGSLRCGRDDKNRVMAGIGVPRLRFAPLGMTAWKGYAIGTAKQAAEKVDDCVMSGRASLQARVQVVYFRI
jgi:hypothetical protein